MLLLPDLAPKSVHISETDEEADLVKLEEKIKAERRAIEDWHKNSTPIGVPPKNPVEEVAPEDESDEDDDEGSEGEDQEGSEGNQPASESEELA